MANRRTPVRLSLSGDTLAPSYDLDQIQRSVQVVTPGSVSGASSSTVIAFLENYFCSYVESFLTGSMSEGASYWRAVCSDLESRPVDEVDDLKVFAVSAVLRTWSGKGTSAGPSVPVSSVYPGPLEGLSDLSGLPRTFAALSAWMGENADVSGFLAALPNSAHEPMSLFAVRHALAAGGSGLSVLFPSIETDADLLAQNPYLSETGYRQFVHDLLQANPSGQFRRTGVFIPVFRRAFASGWSMLPADLESLLARLEDPYISASALHALSVFPQVVSSPRFLRRLSPRAVASTSRALYYLSGDTWLELVLGVANAWGQDEPSSSFEEDFAAALAEGAARLGSTFSRAQALPLLSCPAPRVRAAALALLALARSQGSSPERSARL